MDLDVTLVFQLGLLSGLMLVLNRLVFTPLLQVIESRQQQTHGARLEVKQMERLSAADRQAYARRMGDARRQAFAAREQLRQQGRDQARSRLAEARASLMRAMQVGREQVHAAERATAQELQAATEPLARQLASKLMGREVRG
jgi:F-type H+-transporting ATPase subunit b